jgi:hypothetical protein
MKSLTLSRFDDQGDGAYTVGFDAVFDDGQTRHAVTTVYAANLPNTKRETIVNAARDEIWRGLWMEEQLAGGPPAPPEVTMPPKEADSAP